MTRHHSDPTPPLQPPRPDTAPVTRHLEQMAHLLDLAAATVWTQLEAQRPHIAPHMRAALNSLGLGIHLASSRARRLSHVQETAATRLPDTDPEDVEAQNGPGRSTVQLLAMAAELSRSLSPLEIDLAEGTQLSLDLSDLISEAQDLGC